MVIICNWQVKKQKPPPTFIDEGLGKNIFFLTSSTPSSLFQ
jgi:hypothetical protein